MTSAGKYEDLFVENRAKLDAYYAELGQAPALSLAVNKPSRNKTAFKKQQQKTLQKWKTERQ